MNNRTQFYIAQAVFILGMLGWLRVIMTGGVPVDTIKPLTVIWVAFCIANVIFCLMYGRIVWWLAICLSLASIFGGTALISWSIR